MKYLKKYKILESTQPNFMNIKKDVEDIFDEGLVKKETTPAKTDNIPDFE